MRITESHLRRIIRNVIKENAENTNLSRYLSEMNGQLVDSNQFVSNALHAACIDKGCRSEDLTEECEQQFNNRIYQYIHIDLQNKYYARRGEEQTAFDFENLDAVFEIEHNMIPQLVDSLHSIVSNDHY